jgi:hypothetical protein
VNAFGLKSPLSVGQAHWVERDTALDDKAFDV